MEIKPPLRGAPSSPSSSSDGFEDESRYLRSGYFQALLAIAAAVCVIAVTRAAAWRSSPGLFYTWPMPLALGLGIYLANRLRLQHPRPASWVFIVALTLATALEVAHFPGGPALYFFPIIVVTASQMMSEQDLLACIAGELIAIAVTTAVTWPRVALPDAAWAMIVVVFTGIAAYLGTRQLYTVLRWEWQSTQDALRTTRETQDHRAELMRLNKELDGAYQRLERANSMLVLARQEAETARLHKVQFANAVSHELRSPLNMIIGFSEMMVNSPEVYGAQVWPPRLKNHIQQIYQSSQHLSQLIDDVLDMARINADRLALVKERTPIGDVVSEAAAIVRSLYDARKLYLRVDMAPSLPELLLDRTRIRQVLLNLLTNAIRFTTSGGVTIRVARAGDDIVTSVADTGAGIPPEDLPRLFQEFRQLDGAFYRWQRGSGLGLAISKQLVELHSGRIWADSAPGTGSTFSFALPVGVKPTYLPSADIADGQFWGYLEQKARARKPIVACTRSAGAQRLLASRLPTSDVTWVSSDDALAQALAGAQPFAVVSIADDVASLHHSLALLDSLDGTPLVACALPGLTHPSLPAAVDAYLVKPVSRQRMLETLNQLRRPIGSCLIVEDEAAMQEFLDTALKTARPGCQVRRASTAEQAWAALSAAPPDVVLLDLNLPDADGLELADQMRARGFTNPVVVITARDHPADTHQAEPDVFICARKERFSQVEIEKLLNGALDALAPAAATNIIYR